MTNISFPVATIPAQAVSTTRIIKQFSISGTPKVWVFDSDTLLPP
jgi:hypothetical protein